MKPFVPVPGCRCLGCRGDYTLCPRCWCPKEPDALNRCRCKED